MIESENWGEAVQLLSHHPINTPCYVILGGKQQNEGIIIVRDPMGLNKTI